MVEQAKVLAFLRRRFVTNDSATVVMESGDYEIITGFGPTNAPTAGTLSVMRGIIEAQRLLNAPMTVVISDLGAWNCRNVNWSDLCYFRDRMTAYLIELGFDRTRGEIRTHLNNSNLVRAGRIARFLTLDDFEKHQEEFLSLYSVRGLVGSHIGMLVDTLYTVADVLQPIENGRKGSLVICGLEERYFVELARIILERQHTALPRLEWQGRIGGLYCRIVRGFNEYPKMSKSIPESSIHVGLSDHEITKKILSDANNDQPAILDAIELASDWSEAQISAARSAFDSLPSSLVQWKKAKEAYVETFIRFAHLWTALT